MYGSPGNNDPDDFKKNRDANVRSMDMARQNIFDMPFSKVYPLLVQKAERKGRTKADVDEIITWLTGLVWVSYS